MVGPRFEQTAQEFQPAPLAAIGLIAEEPIRLVTARSASCDGGSSSFVPLRKKDSILTIVTICNHRRRSFGSPESVYQPG